MTVDREHLPAQAIRAGRETCGLGREQVRLLRLGQRERRERAANVVEAGLRYQASEAVTPGAGVGFGIGRDSPRVRALFSVQIGLGGR